jgi:hypothetical protein
MKLKNWILSAVAALGLSFSAHAETITFDLLGGANGDAFTGPFVEDGFTVTATDGDVFVGTAFGNPLPSLVFGSVFGGGAGEVTITSGNTFVLDSFDLNSFGGDASLSVIGLLGGNAVFASASTVLATGLDFPTIAGQAGVIDTLIFDITPGGSSANLDNIVLSVVAVPEPATWLMMIIGFAFVGLASRRRRRTELA